jgi:hypothetical protein
VPQLRRRLSSSGSFASPRFRSDRARPRRRASDTSGLHHAARRYCGDAHGARAAGSDAGALLWHVRWPPPVSPRAGAPPSRVMKSRRLVPDASRACDRKHSTTSVRQEAVALRMLFIQAARVIWYGRRTGRSTALEPGLFAPLNACILMFWLWPSPTSWHGSPGPCRHKSAAMKRASRQQRLK